MAFFSIIYLLFCYSCLFLYHRLSILVYYLCDLPCYLLSFVKPINKLSVFICLISIFVYTRLCDFPRNYLRALFKLHIRQVPESNIISLSAHTLNFIHHIGQGHHITASPTSYETSSSYSSSPLLPQHLMRTLGWPAFYGSFSLFHAPKRRRTERRTKG